MTEPTRPRHEPMDIHVNGILIAFISIMTGIAIAAGMAHFVLSHLHADANGPNAVKPISIESDVVQPSNSSAELNGFLDEKQKRLHSYGWIDRKNERIHIPIESAMIKMIENKNSAQKNRVHRTPHDPRLRDKD